MQEAPPKDRPFYQFVEVGEVSEMIAEAIRPLQAKIIELEQGQSEYVDTKEAMRITGIKTAGSLKRERERAGTLIITKKEGETSKHPRYLRASLHAYNESRRVRPYEIARNLLAG
jgi:hypothetical protein